MSSNNFALLNVKTRNINTYKKKMIYCTSKAFIYGCLLSIVFRKPRVFLPLTLGLAAGYCNNELMNIFFREIE